MSSKIPLQRQNGESEVSGHRPDPPRDQSALQRGRAARRKAVSMKGRMTPRGYEPENAEYLDALTEAVNGRRIGRDPMELPTDLLTAAGHGNRRTSSVVVAMGDVPLAAGLVRHKHLRRHCLGCAENSAEVRRCAIIDCPMWPYRMGRNPHDPRRGRNPFAATALELRGDER